MHGTRALANRGQFRLVMGHPVHRGGHQLAGQFDELRRCGGEMAARAAGQRGEAQVR